MMFSAYFKAVEEVTGKRLDIKCLHGQGLAVILMDGHPGQALGLGDALLEINEPSVSGIFTTDAAEMVQHILRTCDIHCDRYVSLLDSLRIKFSLLLYRNMQPLKTVLTQEESDYVCSFRTISNQEDLDKFGNFCSNHPIHELRGI